MQDRAAEIAYRLKQDFGPLVLAKPVGLDTLRGLWLSLKHRLRNDLYVVVNGKRAVRAWSEYKVLQKVIEEETSVPVTTA